MNLRLIFCVGMGVFTTYMGLLMLVWHFQAKPKYELPPKPNFTARSQEVVDPKTGEKTIYREITVTTKLAEPAPVAQEVRVVPLEAEKKAAAEPK